MVDDNIFREVEDELRRERLRGYWNKYGLIVVAVAVLIIGTVVGVNLWKYWQTSQAEQAGSRYMKALELQREGKHSDAQQSFENLLSTGPQGYQILAKLQLAASMAGDGKQKQAAEIYEKLASDASVDPVLKGFAAIKAAMLTLDESAFSRLESQIKPLADGASSWRHSARELMALGAYKEQKYDVSITWLHKIAGDRDVPQDLKRRAQMLLDIIASKQAEAKATK